MAYGDFDLGKVKRDFGLILQEDRNLFAGVRGVEASELLQMILPENLPLAIAINSEKAKSEFLIAPILGEVRRQLDFKVSLFSGKDFTVDISRGLNGFCDFILSASIEQYFIDAPVLTIIEAKNDNIIAGLGQCIAAMVAAQIFNQQQGNGIDKIYGAVTNGTIWKFLTLEEKTVCIDLIEYYIKEINQILAILMQPFKPVLTAV